MPLPIYKPHKEREIRIASAKTAIHAILPLELYPAHKRELLSICIWKLTQADGKWRTRFHSEGAIGLRGELRHEHVYERRELIGRLLAGEEVDTIVGDAIACIVTEEEHRRLGTATGSGWDRYRTAGIRVYDARDGNWLDW